MNDRVLALSGPPGVGKTTIAWRVFDFLTDSGHAAGFIDLDLMGAAWPAPDDDPHQSHLKAKNAAAVWSNYAAGGTQLLVLAGVIETRTDREALSGALAMPMVLCRLSAPAETLSERIVQRGRDHGPDLAKLLGRAAELQVELERNDIGDFVVGTFNRSVDEIAEELIERWGQLAGR